MAMYIEWCPRKASTKKTGREILAEIPAPQHEPCTAQSTRDARQTQMTVTYLELAKAALRDVLEDLAILESEHDGFTVLGRHYGLDIDRARIARKAAFARCERDKHTLTVAIAAMEVSVEHAAVDAALADPTDPMPQDACAAGVADDESDIAGYAFWFGGDAAAKRSREVA